MNSNVIIKVCSSDEKSIEIGLQKVRELEGWAPKPVVIIHRFYNLRLRRDAILEALSELGCHVVPLDSYLVRGFTPVFEAAKQFYRFIIFVDD